MCLALRLRIRDGAIAAWAREAQGVDVLRAIASATRVAAGKHVGIAPLQGEGDREHEAPLGVGAAPHVVLKATARPPWRTKASRSAPPRATLLAHELPPSERAWKEATFKQKKEDVKEKPEKSAKAEIASSDKEQRNALTDIMFRQAKGTPGARAVWEELQDHPKLKAVSI